MTTTTQVDQLLSALYSAAVTLIDAVTDPLALRDAPLRHRAAALNSVSGLIGHLQKAKPVSVLQSDTRIEWDFGPDDDDEAVPYTYAQSSSAIDPYFSLDASPQPVAPATSPEPEVLAVAASPAVDHGHQPALHLSQPAPVAPLRASIDRMPYADSCDDSRAPHRLSARPSSLQSLVPNPGRN